MRAIPPRKRREETVGAAVGRDRRFALAAPSFAANGGSYSS